MYYRKQYGKNSYYSKTENCADMILGKCNFYISAEVYERRIEDVYEDEAILDGLWEVYHSWINAQISDYNTDFYFQPRDYIAECYREGVVL